MHPLLKVEVKNDHSTWMDCAIPLGLNQRNIPMKGTIEIRIAYHGANTANISKDFQVQSVRLHVRPLPSSSLAVPSFIEASAGVGMAIPDVEKSSLDPLLHNRFELMGGDFRGLFVIA